MRKYNKHKNQYPEMDCVTVKALECYGANKTRATFRGIGFAYTINRSTQTHIHYSHEPWLLTMSRCWRLSVSYIFSCCPDCTVLLHRSPPDDIWPHMSNHHCIVMVHMEWGIFHVKRRYATPAPACPVHDPVSYLWSERKVRAPLEQKSLSPESSSSR